MNELEYLVSHGTTGDFGRFRPVPPRAYERGDRVVVRGPLGLSLGEVLCTVTPNHLSFLSRTALGELLRVATEEDQREIEHKRRRAFEIFEEARRSAAELQLPLEILDVEVAFDESQAVVHHLRRDDCDFRPLVSGLARRFDLLVVMNNLALPEDDEKESSGCGKPDCGKGEGGCSTCSSGGGCSSGQCGKSFQPEEVTAHLLGLRRQMEGRIRTPLV